jgi:hypothetical protein
LLLSLAHARGSVVHPRERSPKNSISFPALFWPPGNLKPQYSSIKTGLFETLPDPSQFRSRRFVPIPANFWNETSGYEDLDGKRDNDSSWPATAKGRDISPGALSNEEVDGSRKALHMQKTLSYPRRPVRAAWLTFLGCSVWVTIFLPFLTDKLPPKSWPVLYAYCALLAVVAIGFVRLGPSALLQLVVSALVALMPGAIGVKLALSPNSVGAGMVWLHISLYLFYAVCALALYFVVRGWSLYFTRRDEGQSPESA